jgi:Flp pilus assembly pilin Flp
LQSQELKQEKKQMSAMKSFLNDESGIETMEYAIIAAIVAAVAILVYGAGWGQALRDKLTGAANVSTNVTL